MDVEASPTENILETAAVVQADWNQLLKEVAFPKFFIGIREGAGNTNFIEVQKTEWGFELENCKNFDTENINLDVKLNGVHLSVPTLGIDTTFLPPLFEMMISTRPIIARSIDVSRSGNLMVGCGADGMMQVVSLLDGNIVRSFEGHIMDVYKCRFFPSGMVVLSCGIDLTVRIWSVEDGSNVRTMKGHTQAVNDIAIIDVGREVMSCSNDGSVIFWSCGEGKDVRRWTPEAGPCNALALDSANSYSHFAVACECKKVVVYKCTEQEACCSFTTTSPASAVAFSSNPNEKFVYVGDEEGRLMVYSLENQEELRKLTTRRGAVTKVLHHRNILWAAFNDGSVCGYKDFATSSNRCPIYELSGSDCDTVYDFVIHADNIIYTSSRDKNVRKYRID